jgi:hypothetical protein
VILDLRRIGLLAGCLGLLGAAVAPAAGQDVLVRAFAQPNGVIADNQQVQLVLRIEGGEKIDVAPPRLTGLVNLEILAGPSRGSSSIWSNGRFSTTVQFVWTLLPKGPGPGLVPALDIEVGGVVQRTAAIPFDVQRAASGPPPPPAAPDRPSAPAPPRAADAADVFLRAEVAAREVWVGQSVPLAVMLYNAAPISGANWIDTPGLARFWVEDVETDPDVEAHPATIEGRRYTAIPMLRKVLVPQSAGEVTIDPFALQLQVRVRGRAGDPFDRIFGRTESIVRRSEPVRLRVRELPAAGRPAEFGGAVGQFRLSAELDRREAAVNEAVALKVSVDGEGVLSAVGPPRVELPRDVKIFDPKISSSSRAVSGRLHSRKTWEWVLVPLAPGPLALPAVRFAYFDPAAGRYAVLDQTLPALAIQRGASAGGEGAARAGEIQVQRRDLAYIKTLDGRRLDDGAARVHGRRLFRTLLVLPLLWVPLLIAGGRFRARLARDTGLARSRRAGPRARRRLSAVRRRIDALDGPKFHEELAQVLVAYAAERFDQSAAGLTYERIDEFLAGRGADGDLRRQVRACLEACDFARFVPAAADSARKTQMLEQVTQLLGQLERVK